MSTQKMKKGLAQELKIPLEDIRVRYTNGWWKVYIRDTQRTEEREKYEFNVIVENIIRKYTDKIYSFISDDGCDTRHSCVMVSFSDFKYI